jgi:hypothetical protein
MDKEEFRQTIAAARPPEATAAERVDAIPFSIERVHCARAGFGWKSWARRVGMQFPISGMNEIVVRPHRSTRLKRDQRTRAAARQLLLRAPHLADPRYVPLVRNFIQVSYILERAFQRLASVDDLFSPKTGEFRYSVDVLRRLSDTHMQLCRELKLSPSTARPGLMDLAGKIADAEK